MPQPAKIFIFLCLFSCSDRETKPLPNNKTNTQLIDILEPDKDTLPNGKRLLDNIDSGMSLYYKEVVSSDTLKGDYIICYGIDDSCKYFYLRHGDTLYLLNKTPIYTSTHGLGTLEKDFDNYFITRVDNGNGVPETYQVFDKKNGKNLLGNKAEAWNFRYSDNSLYFLYDNHTINLTGNHINRKPADSIYLYNVKTGKREGFKLDSKIPHDSYLNLKTLTKHSLTISWVQMMSNEKEHLVKYSR